MKPNPNVDFSDFPDKERDYSTHRNEHWLEKAINPRHPLALRVYFVALGKRKIGGHAPIPAGELGELLVGTGGQFPDRRRVSEAIRACIKWGYLAEGSNALCLIVPLDDVRGGRVEYRCKRGHGRGTAQPHNDDCTCARCSKVSVLPRTDDPQVSVLPQDTSPPSVRSEADTLSVRPLSLLPTATHHDGEGIA